MIIGVSRENVFFFFGEICSVAGIAGVICFTLTIRLAYASLKKKLDARKNRERKKSVRISFQTETSLSSASSVQKTIGIINAFNLSNENTNQSRNRAMTLDTNLNKVRSFPSIFFYSIFLFRKKNVNHHHREVIQSLHLLIV